MCTAAGGTTAAGGAVADVRGGIKPILCSLVHLHRLCDEIIAVVILQQSACTQVGMSTGVGPERERTSCERAGVDGARARARDRSLRPSAAEAYFLTLFPTYLYSDTGRGLDASGKPL